MISLRRQNREWFYCWCVALVGSTLLQVSHFVTWGYSGYLGLCCLSAAVPANLCAVRWGELANHHQCLHETSADFPQPCFFWRTGRCMLAWRSCSSWPLLPTLDQQRTTEQELIFSSCCCFLWTRTTLASGLVDCCLQSSHVGPAQNIKATIIFSMARMLPVHSLKVPWFYSLNVTCLCEGTDAILVYSRILILLLVIVCWLLQMFSLPIPGFCFFCTSSVDVF